MPGLARYERAGDMARVVERADEVAATSRSRAILVRCEPGIGKSILLGLSLESIGPAWTVVNGSDLKVISLPVGDIPTDIVEDAGDPQASLATIDNLLPGGSCRGLAVPPGRCALFCDLPGHFAAGMHAIIEATSGT